MNSTFADTFYYLALLNPGDAAHKMALAVTAQRGGTLVTTSWVLTEVGDAFASPKYRSRFLALIHAIQTDPATIVVPTTDQLFQKGVDFYSQRLDKAWPLTDCISFLVMEQFGIREALTGDSHFTQAGFIPLLRDSA
jgi:predicted nucleic acid-binding protein